MEKFTDEQISRVLAEIIYREQKQLNTYELEILNSLIETYTPNKDFDTFKTEYEEEMQLELDDTYDIEKILKVLNNIIKELDDDELDELDDDYIDIHNDIHNDIHKLLNKIQAKYLKKLKYYKNLDKRISKYAKKQIEYNKNKHINPSSEIRSIGGERKYTLSKKVKKTHKHKKSKKTLSKSIRKRQK